MINKFFRKYFTAAFFLNAPPVINSLVVLAFLPMILSNLQAADYGKLQFILALQVWLSAISGDNISIASKRGVAQGLNGTLFYGFLSRLKLLVPTGLLVLGIAFFLKYLVLKDNMFSILIFIMGIYLLFGFLFQVSLYEFLIAKKKFKSWCFWQILITSLSMIGSALVAFFTKNVILFASFQLGSIIFLSIAGFLWILKRENIIDSYKKGEIDRECVPYGLKLIPVDLISQTGNKITHFIIGPFFGFANLAVFSVANKLRDKCAGFIKSARPLLYSDFAKMNKKELLNMINFHLVRIGILGLLVFFGFGGAGWFYIKYFLPETFHDAIIYFLILALGLPAVVLAIVLHTILESHLRYKELRVAIVIPNLFKILSILLFGYFWQIIGICIAIMISSWITLGFYYLLTMKKNSMLNFILKYPFLQKLPHF